MIKQTQTKLFDFSDTELDFCLGSKNKLQEVFKKMLSDGFNAKTANNVSIDGNQITLTYGVSHGYVSKRVLQITATGGFDKEVYIDDVTSSTVTCTVLDGDTTGLSGTISTKIAPLGWILEYEQANIQIFKMKHIDDSDRYVRFCFETVATNRSSIAVCIGKTTNLTTGVIDDPMALQSTKDIVSPSPANIPRWDNYSNTSAANNWTYAQAFAAYGAGMAIGSLYHFALLGGDGYTSAPHHIYGIFPTVCHNYAQLDYPILISLAPTTAGNTNGNVYGNLSQTLGQNGYASVGNIRVRFDFLNTAQASAMNTSTAAKPESSFLSTSLDNFNTTTCRALEIYERSTSQHLGYCYGIFHCMYDSTNMPTINISNSPHITTDIDFNNLIAVAISGQNNNAPAGARFFAFPIEEVKNGA